MSLIHTVPEAPFTALHKYVKASRVMRNIEVLAGGRNINYDGPGGTLAINASGEMISAVFERFTFDDNGRDVGAALA